MTHMLSYGPQVWTAEQINEEKGNPEFSYRKCNHLLL